MAVIDNFINQVSDNTISIEYLKDVILNTIQTKTNLFIWGFPGIGKSQLVSQVVSEINNLLLKTTADSDKFLDKDKKPCCFELIDCRLSLYDISDILGYPSFENDEFGQKRTKFSVPNIFPTNPKWKGIIFLDEFDQSSPSVMKASYQMILDHRINEFKFPEGAIFIAAGNGTSVQGYSNELPSALKNRFIHITVKENLDYWISWAIKNNIHSSIISFLKSQHPELLLDKASMDLGDDSFATPRGWETVSKILNSNASETIKQIQINGTIGFTTGSLFWSYYKKEKRLPKFEDILEGKIDIDDKSLDIFYNCVIGCLTKIIQNINQEERKEWVSNLSKSINKLNKNENVVFAGKLMFQILSTKDTDSSEFLKILKRIKEAKSKLADEY